MEKGKVTEQPEQTPVAEDGKKTSPVEKKKEGVDFTAAAGTIMQVVGNVALFTGLTGAAILILAIMIDPLGLWAIPLLLAGGYLVNSGGKYMDHKSNGTQKEFTFFPGVRAQAA